MKRIDDNAGSMARCNAILKLILFMALVAALASPPMHCLVKTPADAADVFFPNEELTYEVSWMGIPLGEIRTIMSQQPRKGEEKFVTALAYIRSYSGVPFVDLYEVDETTMDRAGIPVSFHAREKDDDKWKFTDYTFDQQKHRLFAKVRIADSESGNGSVLKNTDSVNIPKNCVDGLSLLFFARVNVRNTMQATVPTFIKGKQGTTIINFYRKTTSTEIDAVDYPVDALEIDGEAQFSGIAGMTGGFTGWFSNDKAQIPIKGKFKIIIGSITIELKQWKRPGWNPPRSNSAR